MPHVGDGDIHAYLDGALGLYPQAEAERIRLHLAECGDCAARLAGERAVRSQADQILSRSGPDSIEIPPFEDVVAATRPETPAARPRWALSTTLAWAATLVLATAVGWAGRGVLMPPDQEFTELDGAHEVSGEPGPQAIPVSESPVPAEAAAASGPRDALEASVTSGRVDGPASELETITEVREEAKNAPGAAGADRRADPDGAPERARPAGDETTSPVAAPREQPVLQATREAFEPDPSVVAAEGVSALDQARRGVAPADFADSRDTEEPAPGAPSAAIPDDFVDPADAPRIERRIDELVKVSGGRLTLSDLGVVALGEAGAPWPEGSVRVVHALPDGGRIELVHGLGPAPDLQALLPAVGRQEGPGAEPAAARVVESWPGGWTVAAGPLSPDSLRTLARTLRPPR